MANINCGEIKIDTEDIDLLVKYLPLATLDEYVRADASILLEMKPDDPLRSWMQHRAESHIIARDLKEKTINAGAEIVRPIIQPKPVLEKEIIREAQKPKRKVYMGIRE